MRWLLVIPAVLFLATSAEAVEGTTAQRITHDCRVALAGATNPTENFQAWECTYTVSHFIADVCPYKMKSITVAIQQVAKASVTGEDIDLFGAALPDCLI